jgi:hypothetical protein
MQCAGNGGAANVTLSSYFMAFPNRIGFTLQALCALYGIGFSGSHNMPEVPQESGIVNSPLTSGPLSIVPGEPLFPQINPPRSPLLNECAFCESGRAEWHRDIRMLTHMAYECGFDYLLLRFDRLYKFDTVTAEATYYFSITSHDLRFDSATVKIGTRTAIKSLLFPCGTCTKILTLAPSSTEDTSFSSKLHLIGKAENFAKSFSSAMLARNRDDGLRVAFSFGLAGKSFVLDERTGVSTTAFPPDAHGIDTGCAAYKLACYFNPTNVSSGDKAVGNGPAIRNVTLSYTSTQQVSITFTAASDIGLREAEFNSDAYRESVHFDGTKREGITKSFPLDSSHYRLTITVFDIDGNSASASYPVFEAKREEGRIAQARRKRIEQERLWAEKNPLNGALYTLGQFDGNIGMWIKAITNALIAQDAKKDAKRDTEMKNVAREKNALPQKPSAPPASDTGRTGVEVIGE